MKEDFTLPGNIEELMELLETEDIQQIAHCLVDNYYRQAYEEYNG